MEVDVQPRPGGERLSAEKVESLIYKQLARRAIDNQYTPTPDEYEVFTRFSNRRMRNALIAAGATFGANYVLFDRVLRNTRAYRYRHVAGLTAALATTTLFGSGDKRAYLQSLLQLQDSPMATEARIILSDLEGPNGPWYRQYGPRELRTWDGAGSHADVVAGGEPSFGGLRGGANDRRRRRPPSGPLDDRGDAEPYAPRGRTLPMEERRGHYRGYEIVRERRPDAFPARYKSDAGLVGGATAEDLLRQDEIRQAYEQTTDEFAARGGPRAEDSPTLESKGFPFGSADVSGDEVDDYDDDDPYARDTDRWR